MWLPRLLEKARRAEMSGPGRLIDGYCYGDNDFIDARVLKFLRTNDRTVSALVREHPDDAAVARRIVASSGRTRDECRNFSRRLRRTFLNFAMLEADEGRMTPGLKRTIIRFAYNGVLMPAVYAMFRRAEERRPAE